MDQARPSPKEELAQAYDAWRISPLGVRYRLLLAKWRAEMQDLWASDSLGDSRSEEQLRGQCIFAQGLLDMDAEIFLEELDKKGIEVNG